MSSLQSLTPLSHRATFLLIVLVVLTSVSVATASVLWRLRSEAITRQFALATLTARALEDHLTQSLNVVERTLLLAGSSGADNARLQSFLQQAPYLRSLALLDEHGYIRVSSSAANLGVPVSMQAYMPQSTAPLEVLRTGPLTVGRDFADASLPPSRALHGLSFIPLALDVAQPNQGWRTVLAALNTDYFLNFYGNHISPQQGSVALLRYDGSLLLSTDPDALPGLPLRPSRLLSRLAQTDADSYREAAGAGGPARLTAYRASRAYPFVVSVQLDEAVALADWRREAWRTALVVGITLAMLLGLATLYYLRFERLARARARDEEDLRIAAAAFESQEGIFVTDTRSVILRVNRAFTDITGYRPSEAVGKTPRLLRSGRHDADFYRQLWHHLLSHGSWSGEVWNRRKNGEVYPEWLTITAVEDQDGQVSHYVAMLTDITQRKAQEQEIRDLAYYDPLTRLPNRRLLLERLQQALRHGQPGLEGGLMFIDLDNFKTLNDTLGHDMGDILLQQVGRRLLQEVGEDDTVARLGGDEFVILLPALGSGLTEAASRAQRLGENLRLAMNQPYDLAGHEYHCTPSIGISLFADGPRHSEDLMKRADLALYSAKAAGRNAVCFFDAAMQHSVTARARLEKALRQALQRDELQLYYQPQVGADGRVLGAEALLRWQSAELGELQPTVFLPLAEESGMILPIGQWVLEQACRQLVRWAAQPQTAGLVLSVNVSVCQLRQADFVARVEDMLTHTGAPPAQLLLELTESVLMDDMVHSIDKMRALRRLGVRFALDDFGTGYSSLSYLRQLPLDQLKLDHSFVQGALDEGNDAAIVDMVLALARSLQLEVLAEGVETAPQHACLLQRGCTRFQGYLFGAPMTADSFERLLDIRQLLPPPAKHSAPR
ncbi:MAG: putative bifunctional diguanylate cyclase/phosphodiesterase [Vogesella sp.]|uniref:putative bifunctional diguanylate cyclase/phosphodiesterase n=1 Tax=Vogesella sp. TaxID=1904252 RepID=UPI0039191786